MLAHLKISYSWIGAPQCILQYQAQIEAIPICLLTDRLSNMGLSDTSTSKNVLKIVMSGQFYNVFAMFFCFVFCKCNLPPLQISQLGATWSAECWPLYTCLLIFQKSNLFCIQHPLASPAYLLLAWPVSALISDSNLATTTIKAVDALVFLISGKLLSGIMAVIGKRQCQVLSTMDAGRV